jgi:maltooligosyltrehalose trehalohydrolase
VILDVVYNHLGPDGAYLHAFSPFYFSSKHRTPWGPAINLDGEHSATVRALLIQNAVYWLQEFHLDGLRLDATHALIDDGPRHFLAELRERVRAALHPRKVVLIAEDDRNEARLIRAPAAAGYGLDAVWADDLHHQVRRHVAGDDEGYFADYSGSTEDIATTIQRGWFYCGQRLPTSGRPRGSAPEGLAPEQFVVCLQNHDQVGNRALGDRLHDGIAPAVYRAVSVLLLSLPQTPLLFMGQEWAAGSPFLYFTDHRAGLGAQVRRGRRREFAAFRAFADRAARAAIPDPQALETFQRSHLDWSELDAPAHAAVHELYRSCLRLRAAFPFRTRDGAAYACSVLGVGILALVRWTAAHAALTIVNLDGATNRIDLEQFCQEHWSMQRTWSIALHTEEPAFTTDAQGPLIDLHRPFPLVAFARPGAIVLTAM